MFVLGIIVGIALSAAFWSLVRLIPEAESTRHMDDLQRRLDAKQLAGFRHARTVNRIIGRT